MIVNVTHVALDIERQRKAAQAYDKDPSLLLVREEYFAASNALVDMLQSDPFMMCIFLFGMRCGVEKQRQVN